MHRTAFTRTQRTHTRRSRSSWGGRLTRSRTLENRLSTDGLSGACHRIHRWRRRRIHRARAGLRNNHSARRNNRCGGLYRSSCGGRSHRSGSSRNLSLRRIWSRFCRNLCHGLSRSNRLDRSGRSNHRSSRGLDGRSRRSGGRYSSRRGRNHHGLRSFHLRGFHLQSLARLRHRFGGHHARRWRSGRGSRRRLHHRSGLVHNHLRHGRRGRWLRGRSISMFLARQDRLQRVPGLADLRQVNLRAEFFPTGALACRCAAHVVEVLADLHRFVFFHRAGVRLFFRDAHFYEHVENLLALHFQLACQIVDSNLHPPFVSFSPHRPIVAGHGGRALARYSFGAAAQELFRCVVC